MPSYCLMWGFLFFIWKCFYRHMHRPTQRAGQVLRNRWPAQIILHALFYFFWSYFNLLLLSFLLFFLLLLLFIEHSVATEKEQAIPFINA